MTVEDVRLVSLVIHIAAGSVAVVVAIVVMSARAHQDWATRWGMAYVGCVLSVAVSSLVLILVASPLPTPVQYVLAVIAVATAVVAVVGYRMARRRRSGVASSRPVQLRLMWGSVTSLVSAIAVVSAPVFVWVPVIIAGSVLTELGYQRASRDPAWA